MILRTRRSINGSQLTVLRSIALTIVTAMVGISGLVASQPASAEPVRDTGFAQPFAGPEQWLGFAPTKAKRKAQVNKPLGQAAADRIAAGLGFSKRKAFSDRQRRLYLSGRGVGGGGADAKKAAQLTSASLRILTNTRVSPMYRTINGVRTAIVLGSYGLVVSKSGLLESPANASVPTRQINWVLSPQALCRKEQPPPDLNFPPGTCGYMGRWMKANGARDTLRALYSSAYASELSYGAQSQAQQEPHELLTNTRGSTPRWVGMPMAPTIWIVNFLLIYALDPSAAAKMPAYWTPIPEAVANAIVEAGGQVPYADYMDYFTR